MQILPRKFLSTIVCGAVVTLLAVVARILLMINGFDFDTHFYKNNIWATFLYCLVLVFAIIIFSMSKDIKVTKIRKDMSDVSLSIFSVVTLVGLLIVKFRMPVPEITIGKITYWGAVISLMFSVVFYLINAIEKINVSTALILLNIAPVIYLTCQLIDCFTAISIKANSYYLFPHVISILTLAFYVLYNGKLNTLNESEKGLPMLSYSLLSVLFLSFSVFPDCILALTGKLSLTYTDLFLSVLKVIYIVFSVVTVIKITRNEAEGKI